MEEIWLALQAEPQWIALLAVALLAIGGGGFALGRRGDSQILEDDGESELLPPLPEKPRRSKPAAPKEQRSVLDRFRRGLARTSQALGLGGVFGGDAVDDALFEALGDALIGADVGVRTTTSLLEELRERARDQGITEPSALRGQLKELVQARMDAFDPALKPRPAEGPYVILVVGINGSGKTTTIGKLAARFKAGGDAVLMGAGDTFRAGAIEQLRVWSKRAGADFVAHQEGADPAAVLFDALKAAKARGADVVLCDTAGRLQSQKPLMDELGKVTRVVSKGIEGAPHEVLLVLDATIGQNALSQARTFGAVTGVTGVVLTKLDGTAKGGVVIAVASELKLPVKFIGIGEQIDDLRPFEPAVFVEALLG